MQLKEYKQPVVSARGNRVEGESTVTVNITGSGGTGGYAYRIIAVGADGAQAVVSDWASATERTLTVDAGATLRCEMRDATGIEASCAVAVTVEPAPVVVEEVVKVGDVCVVGGNSYRVTAAAACSAAGAVTFTKAKVPFHLPVPGDRRSRYVALSGPSPMRGRISQGRTPSIGSGAP